MPNDRERLAPTTSSTHQHFSESESSAFEGLSYAPPPFQLRADTPMQLQRDENAPIQGYFELLRDMAETLGVTATIEAVAGALGVSTAVLAAGLAAATAAGVTIAWGLPKIVAFCRKKGGDSEEVAEPVAADAPPAHAPEPPADAEAEQDEKSDYEDDFDLEDDITDDDFLNSSFAQRGQPAAPKPVKKKKAPAGPPPAPKPPLTPAQIVEEAKSYIRYIEERCYLGNQGIPAGRSGIRVADRVAIAQYLYDNYHDMQVGGPLDWAGPRVRYYIVREANGKIDITGHFWTKSGKDKSKGSGNNAFNYHIQW